MRRVWSWEDDQKTLAGKEKAMSGMQEMFDKLRPTLRRPKPGTRPSPWERLWWREEEVPLSRSKL